MPFPRYCAQNHASKEHEVFDDGDGQVVSFAVHIRVKPQPQQGGSPKGFAESPKALQAAASDTGRPTLLGRTMAALAAEAEATFGNTDPPIKAEPLYPSALTCSPVSSSSLMTSMALNVKLVRNSFQPLGLRLEALEESDAWEIVGLEPGVVQHWNQEHPQQRLLPGDIITSINGETTTIGMECAMAADPTLEMRLWRPASAARKMSL
jgi:hypothetical protein